MAVSDGRSSQTSKILQRNCARKLIVAAVKIDTLCADWIKSAEEAAKRNQAYNHQILHTIREEAKKIFEEELKKLA